MLSNSDIQLRHAEYNPFDHRNKIGGDKSLREVIESEVGELFTPGSIYPSDFSDTAYYQYRKIFLTNNSETENGTNARIYGYNLKGNGIVKFAIEKGQNKRPILDGQETIPNAKTEPNLNGDYDWTEAHSDSPLLFASVWPKRTSQGVWLKMATDEFVKADALDQFIIGVKTD